MSTAPNPPDSLSIPSKDCINAVYNLLAAKCQQVLAKEKEVDPQIFFFHVPPGAPQPSQMGGMGPDAVRLFFNDARGKAALTEMVRSALDPASELRDTLSAGFGFKPNLIVVISEAWVVKASAVGPADQSAREAAMAFLGKESLSKHPQRQEAVTLQVHSERGTVIGCCPLTRAADGTPSMEITPLNEMQMLTGGMTLQGGFEGEVEQSLKKAMAPRVT